jgi:hypothetical protein
VVGRQRGAARAVVGAGTGVRDRVQAVILAYESGVITPGQGP